ncbi:hypothetical protein AUP68_08904 [Ilyonectria robusta]
MIPDTFRYPSLLESSDIDGGSSVAVLTYLRRILESLDHPDMINLILHYLLALPDSLPSNRPGSRSSVSLARKRKSMDLATMMAEKSDTTVTPLLFNLVDLILACLRSRNQQTIYVTLQLVSAILKRHHRYAIITLLRTDIIPMNNPRRTVGAHEQEVEYMMALAGTIGGQDNFDEVYQSVLRDTMSRLESHPCSIKLVAPRVSASNQRLPAVADSLPGAPRDVGDHTLRPDDPLLNALLDLLETFFINPVETNLSVTETLVDLAICGYMKIEGWLARNPGAYTYGDEDDTLDGPADDDGTEADAELDRPRTAEEEQIKAMERCRQRPLWTQTSVPRVLNVLKHLEEQVVSYRKTIPRFDDLVQQRREAFQTADAMSTPIAATQKATPVQQETPDRGSLDEASRSASPSRPSALEGLAHRLLSELGTPSRSNTPRGRKEQTRSSRSGNATPGSKPGLAPPKEIYSERGSSASRRSKSRSRVREETSSSHGTGKAIPTEAVPTETIPTETVPTETVPTEPVTPERTEITPQSTASKVDPEDSDGRKPATVSVSHIVTNVMILQSFLFELASLVQVRAGLFDETTFDSCHDLWLKKHWLVGTQLRATSLICKREAVRWIDRRQLCRRPTLLPSLVPLEESGEIAAQLA